MKWITRERPKIDRLACPWLIKRFVDQDAEIIYVPFSEVIEKARDLDAIPFDIARVEYTHYDDYCTFDYIIKKHNIEDAAIHAMAPIIRGADTDRHDLATQSSGLWAISAGMAHDEPDDYKLLEKGMLLYNSLYSWAKYLQHVKHTQQPFENQLLEFLNNICNRKMTVKRFLNGQKSILPIYPVSFPSILMIFHLAIISVNCVLIKLYSYCRQLIIL